MPSDGLTFRLGVLFGRFPGRLGNFHNCDFPKQPHPEFPWALDNGVFGAHKNNQAWDETNFYAFLDKYMCMGPSWVVVPDAYGDRDMTLRRWDSHYPRLKALNPRMGLAIAVQDGMTPDDVPDEADIVFIGGSTEWKWRHLNMWTEAFDRVHVGRVNTPRMLRISEDAGAESCDGTGWFRSPQRTKQLEQYLEGKDYEQPELSEISE